MNILNRFLSVILLLTIVFSLFSCGEYKPSQGGSHGGKYPTESDDPSVLDDDPTNDFSVQLNLNGQPFIPKVKISVYWNDGYNVHIAPVDLTGRAVIDGLDGDYRVTLSSVPSGYAYDPNAYVATNDNRSIIIDMYDLNRLRGSGGDLYHCYEISDTGVYTVTITEPEQLNYIQFAPKKNGTYTVESWASTVDDEVSPICMAYLGTTQYKYGEYRVTDVGLCGSYTRNFIHTVQIAEESISASGGGSHTFTFAVGAENKSSVYPINVTFAIKRNGGFDIERAEQTTMIPTFDWSDFDFKYFKDLAGGDIVGAETLYRDTTDVYVFDQSNYKLWEKSDGGDGFYHVFDKAKYPETDGYGPILVAYITEPCRFFEADENGNRPSFITIEDAGNNALVVGGAYNYRLFIKGFKALAEAGYYCADRCLCHLDNSLPACAIGCVNCTPECTNVTEAEMLVQGYAEFANADGVVPVTEELREFLQLYVSNSGFFFADGEGRIETDPTHPISADEDSQWLFACGYYK